MKQLFYILVLTFFAPLFAEEVTIDCIVTGRKGAKAHFEKEHMKNKSFSYSNARFLIYSNHPISFTESVQSGLGYEENHFSFAKPLHIRQETFRTASLKFGVLTLQKPCWGFDGSVNVDCALDHPGYDTTKARATLHGNYMLCPNSNLHLGALALFGMRYTRVFPILGIDYIQSKHLSYFFIFPTNASIVYAFTNNTSTNISLKPLFARERLGNQECHSMKKALIAYRALSLELGFNIGFYKNGMFNVHVGKTLNSHLRISSKNDRSRKHYLIKSAPYIGFGASYFF